MKRKNKEVKLPIKKIQPIGEFLIESSSYSDSDSSIFSSSSISSPSTSSSSSTSSPSTSSSSSTSSSNNPIASPIESFTFSIEYLKRLPIEILLLILSSLGTESLSLFMEALSLSNSFYTSLLEILPHVNNVNGFPFDITLESLDFLKYLPAIRELSLNFEYEKYLHGSYSGCLSRLRRLEKLSARNCVNISSYFFLNFQSCSTLQEIQLDSIKFISSQIARVIENMPRLESLTLKNCDLLDTDSLFTLLKSHSLKSLTLDNCNIDYQLWKVFKENKNNVNIKIENFSYIGSDSDLVIEILPFLSHLKNFTLHDIVNYYGGDFSISHLNLYQYKDLEFLDIFPFTRIFLIFSLSFYKLKRIKLYINYEIFSYLIIFPYLEELSLSINYTSSILLPCEISLPHPEYYLSLYSLKLNDYNDSGRFQDYTMLSVPTSYSYPFLNQNDNNISHPSYITLNSLKCLDIEFFIIDELNSLAFSSLMLPNLENLSFCFNDSNNSTEYCIKFISHVLIGLIKQCKNSLFLTFQNIQSNIRTNFYNNLYKLLSLYSNYSLNSLYLSPICFSNILNYPIIKNINHLYINFDDIVCLNNEIDFNNIKILSIIIIDNFIDLNTNIINLHNLQNKKILFTKNFINKLLLKKNILKKSFNNLIQLNFYIINNNNNITYNYLNQLKNKQIKKFSYILYDILYPNIKIIKDIFNNNVSINIYPDKI